MVTAAEREASEEGLFGDWAATASGACSIYKERNDL